MEHPRQLAVRFSLGQIGEALSAATASGTAIGARDAAILVLLCSAGLREREIRTLDVHDVLSMGTALRVRQSDGYQRTIGLSPGATMILARWLEVRGLEPGPLFYCFRRESRTGRQRMSGSAVAATVRNWVPSAGKDTSDAGRRKAIPFASCADWSRTCCCPWVMGFDLVPIDYPALKFFARAPALLPASPAVRYLSQLDSQRRRKCTEALDLLLRALGRMDADVFRFPWSGLTYNELRTALDALPRDFALRTRIRKSLTGVLTQSFRDGDLSMTRFDELCGWSWRS